MNFSALETLLIIAFFNKFLSIFKKQDKKKIKLEDINVTKKSDKEQWIEEKKFFGFSDSSSEEEDANEGDIQFQKRLQEERDKREQKKKAELDSRCHRFDYENSNLHHYKGKYALGLAKHVEFFPGKSHCSFLCYSYSIGDRIDALWDERYKHNET